MLYLGDCLEVLPRIPEGSVDAIIADLPYGTTACKWDSVISLEPLWKEFKRVVKRNGAIVLFGSQPFTSQLVMSNPKWFKYHRIPECQKAAFAPNRGYFSFLSVATHL
jgi:site-specific DNA-methyltransferase (adenine-specific)